MISPDSSYFMANEKFNRRTQKVPCGSGAHRRGSAQRRRVPAAVGRQCERSDDPKRRVELEYGGAVESIPSGRTIRWEARPCWTSGVASRSRPCAQSQDAEAIENLETGVVAVVALMSCSVRSSAEGARTPLNWSG